MRGRKPRPASVVAQKDPVRSRRTEPGTDAPAAQAAPGKLQPTTQLSEAALAYWQALVPTLSAAKLIAGPDVSAFTRYCRNRAKWDEMQELIAGGGDFYSVETASGVVMRQHPAVMIANQLERMLLALEDRFGLNPSERQRIMGARAQTGVTGDLFAPATPRREGDPATPAAPAAEPISGPLGLLN